jgi:hypothetical protein
MGNLPAMCFILITANRNHPEVTRDLKHTKWRVFEYDLTDSSRSESSTRSLAEYARVQIDRLRVCDSEPPLGQEYTHAGGAWFDDYVVPSTFGYGQAPVRKDKSMLQDNNQVISGSIAKRLVSKISSSPFAGVKTTHAPQTFHWRVNGPNWACPFAVHDPKRYWMIGESCMNWQGFQSIARVR